MERGCTSNSTIDVTTTEEIPAATAMISFLRDCSVHHEVFNGRSKKIHFYWIVIPTQNFTVDQTTPVLFASEESLSEIPLQKLNQTLQKLVDKLLLNGKLKFEGVMLDNGAAKSPAGLPAYLRYCTYSGVSPRHRYSNLVFKGMGKGTNASLGLAEVIVLIGAEIA